MARARSVMDWLLWYLREVAGENDYVRYVEHARRHHPDTGILSRREFERRRMDRLEESPRQRCC
jgi:uncharacterized short protein YbdD (DUF466 family)